GAAEQRRTAVVAAGVCAVVADRQAPRYRRPWETRCSHQRVGGGISDGRWGLHRDSIDDVSFDCVDRAGLLPISRVGLWPKHPSIPRSIVNADDIAARARRDLRVAAVIQPDAARAVGGLEGSGLAGLWIRFHHPHSSSLQL